MEIIMRRLPRRTASPSDFLARNIMMLKTVITGQSAVTAVRIKLTAPPLSFEAACRINGTASISRVKTAVTAIAIPSFSVNLPAGTYPPE